MYFQNIIVFGTGYVGLVASACFANMGKSVVCTDNCIEKINALENHQIPIDEPQLPELLENAVKNQQLLFTINPEEYFEQADFFIIAVGTPSLADGSCDTSSVFAVAKQIGEKIVSSKVIIIKSTVPVGTGEQVENIVKAELQKRAIYDIEIFIVSNPEFLKEGSAIDDFLKPERIIIGVQCQEAYLKMKDLYKPLLDQGYQIIPMSIRSAELAKYAANAMLSMRISFMNEMSYLCEKAGANIEEIRLAIGSDMRIGKYFLKAGIGYGGSCFPKDNKALEFLGKKYDVPLSLISATIEANKNQQKIFLNKIIDFFEGGLNEKKISILGVAFKPNTNDTRHSPGLYFANELLKKGAHISLFDPLVTTKENNICLLKQETQNRFEISNSIENCTQNSSAIVLCTEWEEFQNLDFDFLSKNMCQKLFFDGRNQYTKKHAEKYGFTYISVGRP